MKTVCQRSNFYIATHCAKLDNTSWTYSFMLLTIYIKAFFSVKSLEWREVSLQGGWGAPASWRPTLRGWSREAARSLSGPRSPCQNHPGKIIIKHCWKMKMKIWLKNSYKIINKWRRLKWSWCKGKHRKKLKTSICIYYLMIKTIHVSMFLLLSLSVSLGELLAFRFVLIMALQRKFDWT